MGVIAILTLCLVALGIVENALHQRALRSIPLRILVNGTRGKTSVTRMTAAVLHAAGIRAYAKTTGSEARRILPDGEAQAYRRERRPVTLMEQLPFARLAAKGGAQALVVEDMALRMENQALMAAKLVRPHYVLVTNAYVDHVEEIGGTEEETVRVLAQSFPEEATVIAHDRRFGDYTDRLVLAGEPVDMAAFEASSYAVHAENVQLVLALARQLGIPRETAERGIREAQPDIGMYRQFQVGDCQVWNAFAANDPVSFRQALDACAARGPYSLLFNHRGDRAYRLETFAEVLRHCDSPPERVAVIGDDRRWCAGILTRLTGLSSEAVDDPLGWVKSREAGSQVLCAGNIKGDGKKCWKT